VRLPECLVMSSVSVIKLNLKSGLALRVNWTATAGKANELRGIGA
jgi:hypothetical protein